MAGLLLRLRTWWETADRTQKAVTLFGGGFLLLLLFGTFYFASRPKMEMAFGGLTSAEQGTVVEEIQKMGVPVEFDLAGNVSVPSSKVSEVRMRLATSGKLPSGAHWGYADLDKMNSFQTPRTEREKIKSIAEGELAKTIEAIESVDAARVHITLGTDGVFANERRPATASVTISEKSGAGLSGEQAKSIARLVANAVEGLTTENITIVNQNLQPIWIGDSETGANGRANERIQAEISEARRRETQLQQKLDYFFGSGAAVVTVDLRLDFDTATERKSEPIVSDSPVSKASIEEGMKNGSGGTSGLRGGITGTTNNLGAAPGAAEPTAEATGPAGEGYQLRQKEDAFAEGRVDTTTEKAPGEVKSMAITVLVDSNRVEDPTKVEEFVKNYLGPRAADPQNFTAKVTPVARDKTMEAEAAKTAAASAGREQMQQILSMLPIAALLLVAFLVLRGLAKAAKSQSVVVTALPGGRVMPMALGGANDYAGEAANAPELPAGEGAAARVARQVQSQQEEIDELPEITTRINKPLEQIKRMTADRPEVVAMLIKSWLLEERR